MVEPISDEERSAFTRRVKVAFVALVGLSAGLTTLLGDPSLPVVAGAVLGGLAVGGVLVWLVFPGDGTVGGSRGRRP